MNHKNICKNRQTGNFSMLLSFLLILFLAIPAIATAKPVILYTDILSGPNTGGENNSGIYLSIFGKGFGSNINNVTVYVGGGEVASYMYLGPTQYGRADIQQLSVQLGPSASTGSIKLVVNSEESNTDHTFTVRPGDIYFVNNTISDGSDGNGDGEIGNINKPFRYVQKKYPFGSDLGTWDRDDFGPGDFLVVRGTGVEWTDNLYGGGFLKTSKSGEAGKPLTIMGYPGEEIIVPAQKDLNAFRFKLELPSLGHIVIAGFKTKRYAATQVLGNNSIFWIRGVGAEDSYDDSGYIDDIRMVNVYVSGNQTSGNGNIAGVYFKNAKFLGLHHNDNGKDDKTGLRNSAYYFSSFHDVEIAYGEIENQWWGKGPAPKIGYYYNLKIHDEIYHDIGWSCIRMRYGASGDVEIYNNILYNCAIDDIDTPVYIMYGNQGGNFKIYNNTIYANAGDTTTGGILINTNEFNSIELKNNIIYVDGHNNYIKTSKDFDANKITASNNIYFGSGPTSKPTWDDSSTIVDPLFVDAGNFDFHLLSSSPAIDSGIDLPLVNRDFDANQRPMDGDDNGTAETDIGPYEYTGTYIPPQADNTPPSPPTGLLIVQQ